MKTTLFPAVAVAVFILSSIVNLASAEEPQQVVLLDMGQVFKNHTAFNKGMESIRQEFEVFRGQIQQKQGRIQASAEQLHTMKDKNSTEAIQLEATLTKMSADLQVEHQLKSKEFAHREAQLYFQTHMDITKKVNAFCVTNKVSLVLRHSEVPETAKTRQAILEMINNPVIFQRDRDITKYIIQQTSTGPAQPVQGQQASRRPSGQTQR